MKILSFGEIIWDVYENEKFIGGAPLNLAAHCSKQGANSFMLSSVGNDDLGKEAERILKNIIILIELPVILGMPAKYYAF